VRSTRAGKPGFVYKLGLKNGKANIDEYAPIYTPDQWKFDGDNYEPGLPGLAAWAATLGAILLGGAFAVYSTSAL
jgi:photosystem II protein